jgi:AraC-like DNA-binding protein
MTVVVPVVHRSKTLRSTIRQGLPRRGWRVEGCGTLERAEAMMQRRLVDAVVVDVRNRWSDDGFQLLARYPRIPFFAMSAFLPDDAPLIRACRGAGMAGVLVEGVDDPAAGEMIAANAASRRRRAELGDAPRVLRLSEPIQLRAWEEVLARVGSRTTTADIARALKRTREHLSREFAAGGAPNLKRVIDLVRTAWAADLLANPGYSVATVSTVLRFASPSHLADCAQRVAGVRPRGLVALGARGVLGRFVRGRMRSRV